MTSTTTVRISLSVLIAAGAVAGAVMLGGGHGPQTLVAATVAAAVLLHVASHVVIKLTEVAAEGFERRLERGSAGDRPATNEDLQRAGRRAALRGVKIAVSAYFRSVKANLYSHDLTAARSFRKAALKWVESQERQTRRKDRPADGGWNRPGLGLDAVMRLPGREQRHIAKISRWEQLARDEFVHAMKALAVEAPTAFDAFFVGAENCGLGWRRAGHLVFMRILKREPDALVGFTVEVQTQMLDELRGLSARLAEPDHRLAPAIDDKVASPRWRSDGFWRAGVQEPSQSGGASLVSAGEQIRETVR